MIDEKLLIERLEEEKKYCSYHPHTRDETINKAISIVNQLAEEYNNEAVKGDLISKKDVFRMIEKQQDIARGDGGTLMSLALLKSDIERISAPYHPKGE